MNRVPDSVNQDGPDNGALFHGRPMTDDVLMGLLVPAHPCKCGHGVFDHGDDPRDTGCTECVCPRFEDEECPGPEIAER
jgi:hypothetical protein